MYTVIPKRKVKIFWDKSVIPEGVADSLNQSLE
jgi:hypothetical protein